MIITMSTMRKLQLVEEEDVLDCLTSVWKSINYYITHEVDAQQNEMKLNMTNTIFKFSVSKFSARHPWYTQCAHEFLLSQKKSSKLSDIRGAAEHKKQQKKDKFH